jgi:type I restriction enzyme M protein
VQLTGQLFANTQIPCGLWFLSKNRDGRGGFRGRKDEILFIDARKLGALISGSRKQKQLADEEIERIAAVYREYKRTGRPAEQPGFAKVATLDEVRAHGYALTPGRYIGAAEADDEDEPFEERFPLLVKRLHQELDEGVRLGARIREQLSRVCDV